MDVYNDPIDISPGDLKSLAWGGDRRWIKYGYVCSGERMEVGKSGREKNFVLKKEMSE